MELKRNLNLKERMEMEEFEEDHHHLLLLYLDLGLLHSSFVLCIILPPWFSSPKKLAETFFQIQERFSSLGDSIACLWNARLNQSQDCTLQANLLLA
jgi:hypothetical protein